MAETRRKFDQDFKEGAVRLVRSTGKPIARRPGSWDQAGHAGDNCVARDRRQREAAMAGSARMSGPS
jgi:transposase